jgi:hypothetical protein
MEEFLTFFHGIDFVGTLLPAIFSVAEYRRPNRWLLPRLGMRHVSSAVENGTLSAVPFEPGVMDLRVMCKRRVGLRISTRVRLRVTRVGPTQTPAKP